MYVPGLNRRLFSVTQFAQHGHQAIVQRYGTTLLFGPRSIPVTIMSRKNAHATASNLSVTTNYSDTESDTYHKIPAYRNKDNDKKRLPLDLLHQRLGHRKSRTLLAATEHDLWQDTTIRMTGKAGCLTCGVATIRSRARNKEAHSGASRPGEYLFLDIQHPFVEAGLTVSTSYAFYLLIVDAYSRYAKLYGLPKKSTAAVISALQQYQADHSPAETYGYLDTTRIRTDAGSQFTSTEFARHCVQQGIALSLAAPKKQYQNHIAERTWQTITSTARSLLVHARIPDTFWYHALVYSTYIFNALPVRGLQGEDTELPATPHERFFNVKPRIGHFRTFGCPVVIRKWTSLDNSNSKQTERGIRGIFIGLDSHQKGYFIYCPGSQSIVISDDVIFDEQFHSAIAHTWQKYHNGLAFRPLASFIPDVTTTLEHTGTISTDHTPVEEGSNTTADEEGDNRFPQAVNTIAENFEDDCPDLVPHNHDDDNSESDYDDDSAGSLDDDTEDPYSDDLTHLLCPIAPEPEQDTPQPQSQQLCRSTRLRKPNPKYASIASTVFWDNVCVDEELQEACAAEAHPTVLSTLNNAVS
jgi:transposase InsO family protein